MSMQLNKFQALADPARLQILETMKTGERAVGDIVACLASRQSGVSRHLRILAEAGIVQVRPEKQKRFYSLRQEAFDELEAWISAYRQHWDMRLDRFGKAVKLRQKSKPKPKITDGEV